MPRILLALVIGLLPCLWQSASAQQPESRLALVVGNGAYPAAPLATAANDAGLIAQTLQAAGFDVIGARDLDGETLRKSLRDFVQKVQEAGPDTVAFVYLAGYGIQLTGENYFVPVDAKIARDTDIPIETLRVSDYMHQLSALPLKAGIIVLDAGRAHPFAKDGQSLAGGLALVEPDDKTLIAFNAAPGTVAPEGQPPYGAYAQALAEMIRAGGVSLPELFDRVRLRVNETTKGAQIPWNAQKIETSFMFFERQADAPPVEVEAGRRTKPIRDFSAQDAYAAAIERDTLQGYEDFLQAFPNDPLAKRVRAIVAARREAIIWRRSYHADTPQAYWSYLDRYPRGPHASDARRRLASLQAALAPPPSFAPIVYDVPPPPPDEIIYVDRPVLYFDDPAFAFAPPPPPRVIFLPPRPRDFVVLPPPRPPVAVFVLPTPAFVAMPRYVRPPAYVRPPPNNIVFNNIHNTTVINNVINNPTYRPPRAAAPGARAGAPITRAAIAPSLPPAVVQRAKLGPAAPPPGLLPGARGRLVPPTVAVPPPVQPGAARPLPTVTPTATLPKPVPGKPVPPALPARPAPAAAALAKPAPVAPPKVAAPPPIRAIVAPPPRAVPKPPPPPPPVARSPLRAGVAPPARVMPPPAPRVVAPPPRIQAVAPPRVAPPPRVQAVAPRPAPRAATCPPDKCKPH